MLTWLRSTAIKPRIPPVAIGGVGGSGTRLIARFLLELGYYLGSDLNESNDNIWFALLFTRPETLRLPENEFCYLLSIYFQALTTNKPFSPRQLETIRRLVDPKRRQPLSMLQAYCDSLSRQQTYQKTFGPWGWKAPNTHVFIDRFFEAMPNMKYIHVARNGLDMAYSDNQNQLDLWGKEFLGADCEPTQRYSLKFWVKAHQRVMRLCAPMGDSFYFLDFDKLCQNPHAETAALLDFLRVQGAKDQVADLAKLIVPPKGIGRYREYGLGAFDAEDIAYVKELGFDVGADI